MKKELVVASTLCALLFFGIGIVTQRYLFTEQLMPEVAAVQEDALINTPGCAVTNPTYQAKQFDIGGNIKGLSKNQIDQHLTLYKGYVNKRNEISQGLQTVTRTKAGNRTYSPFRGLKVAETYALNGALLHELYFENLSIDSTDPENMSPRMKALVEKSFGSIACFKEDFMDCGETARGWVITAYGIDDGLLHNYVLEEHNQHVPVLIIPLIVLDCYEHAYMIDYGINRNPYLKVFWDHINWHVVEKRIAQWVAPLNSKLSSDGDD